nr:MAG TPA: hypothetical protein [Caudoviricetes sp.]
MKFTFYNQSAFIWQIYIRERESSPPRIAPALALSFIKAL